MLTVTLLLMLSAYTMYQKMVSWREIMQLKITLQKFCKMQGSVRRFSLFLARKADNVFIFFILNCDVT